MIVFPIFVEKNCDMEIPRGNSREDIKARRIIIKDFYAKWISEHQDKMVWNKSLEAFILVKNTSINEILGHAPKSVEATAAQFHLTKILSDARLVDRWPPKHGDKNQKIFSTVFLLRWRQCRLLVGFQKSKGEYVLYYISGGQKKKSRQAATFE